MKRKNPKSELTNNHATRLDQEYDVRTLINYANYFLEHLEELVFGGSDPERKGAMFGLLFQQAPTYTEITTRTPHLSPLFNQYEEKETMVTLTTLTSNTLISLLNEWQEQNLLEPIEPESSFGANYLRGLES